MQNRAKAPSARNRRRRLPVLRCLLRGGLLLLLWMVLPGPPATGEPPQPSGYVLLRNGNVLRGSLHVEGSQMLIRRAGTSTIRLAGDRVACWSATLEGLYRHREQTRTPHRLTPWFEDVDWAIRHNLFAIAERELARLQRIAPRDERYQRLVVKLAQARQRSQSPPAAPTVELASATTPLKPQTDSQPAATEAPSSARQPFSAEVLATYTRQLQPLMVNRCGQAGCHGGASAAKLQLKQFDFTTRLPAKWTRENLRATLRFVTADAPEDSPLWTFATKPHGGSKQPPLGPHDRELIERLRGWINQAATRPRGGLVPTVQPLQFETVSAGATPRPTLQPSGQDPATSRPQRLPRVEDPFDPDLFNRLSHPD